MRLSRVLVVISYAFPACSFAQVVIDGTTPTTVTVNPSGSVTVGVAPATTDGVSLNRYNQFNVASAGVNLDNRSIAARTIVNEVTGASRTNINGAVEVLGQKAHVIVANPNGIVIDGGRFVNTGRVALTTGKLSFNARQIAPGIFQDNVVSTVTGGSITVSGGGLSGQMDAIDLIAHSIKINGQITNSSANANAGIRLASGQSSTEFYSSVLPGNTGLSWGRITGTGGSSDGAVLVEITRQGVLRANRIGIEINDHGAGARIAGEGYANSREFILRADGNIDLAGANITAAGALSVSGSSVHLDNSSLVSSDGVASIAATKTDGDGVTGLDFTLSGNSVFLNSEHKLQFFATSSGRTQITSHDGDITLQAKAGFSDENGHYNSARNLYFNGETRLSFSESTLEAAQSIKLDSKGGMTAEGIVATAAGHVLVTADEATINEGQRRSEIKAINGSLILTTLGLGSEGNLINTGGLLQGGTVTADLMDGADTPSNGAVTLNVHGSFINASAEDLAIVFGAAGDVYIRSGQNIENNRGRLLANGNVKLIAAGDVLNLLEHSEQSTNPEVVKYTRKGKRVWWTLWLKRKRESVVAYDYGELEHADQKPSITANGHVSIEANAVLNQGGDINANNGDVEIKALRVETIGLGAGKVSVRKVCVFTCSYTGDGAVSFYGGSISASNDVSIAANETFYNKGGRVFAINDVEIITPKAVLEAHLVPTLVTRPKGLYNFWSSKAAWIFLRDQFGSIVADTGNITVRSQQPIKIIGGETVAGGTVDLENGQEIVRAATTKPTALGHRIGLFGNLPLIHQD